MIRLLAAVALLALPLAAQKRPNVVMIIGDDQAWTDFGFMGHPAIKTPHLDRLAGEGALFTRGSVPSSLCRPSLASMITGKFPHRHGVTGNDPQPGVDRQVVVDRFKQNLTLPQLLGKAGYRSFQSGKWWEGNHRDGGFTAGMTHGDTRRGGRHGDEGLKIGRQGMQPIYDFIEGGKEPFFLWYAPFLPHTPHNPPQRLLQKYAIPGRSKFIARYYAMCEWFDETCGQLLGYLKRTGLEENTIVLFVNDNGWIQRKNNGRYAPRSKRSPYEGGVRTPIMVKWPGKVAPMRTGQPISSLDLFPTICKACGVDLPPGLDGHDLMPLIQQQAVEPPNAFGAAFTHDIVDIRDPVRSLKSRWVFDGRFKLIWPHARKPRLELYDVVEDPHEKKNLAAAEPDRAKRLQKSIREWWDVPGDTRPNFLVVVTDDQRNDMMGCAGHPILQTPTMDALAARGVRFTNAFVTTAICAASRATIFTGLPRRTHGFSFKTPPLATQHIRKSYPALLKAAGWRTGFVGKLGIKLARGGANRMFDSHQPLSFPYFKKRDDKREHLTDTTAARAIEFLQGCDGNQPFCLSVSFHAPHAEDPNPQQYVWPKALDGMYDDVPIPPPPAADHFDKLPEFLQKSLGRVRWKWRFDSEAKRVAMTRGYYRMITGADRALGRILAQLEKQGLADDTVVLFLGDNGYFLGERGLAGKWFMYEPSIRVPMIVCDPRAPAKQRGVTNEELVLNLDIASTVLSLAGMPIPGAYEGRDLTPLVRGERVSWRSRFAYEHLFDHKAIPKSTGVRTRRYKYIRYFEQKPVYEELFDLEADPLELHNRIADPALAAVLAELRG